jgi:CBS domain-containing protein
MNTKLVSSIDAATRSRLAVVGDDTLLREVARLLSGTQISLVVVCDAAGTMVGIITKTNIVRQIGNCQGAACTGTAAEIMTRDVTFCGPADCLPDVLSMMLARGFVHVPVVDAQRKPSGVVNARDALRELWAEGQYEEALLRHYVMGVGYR